MVNIENLTRKCILTRKAYIPGRSVEEVKRELGLTDIIKMASNENPLGTSPLALEAMAREIRNASNRYPESLCHDLAVRLAAVHQVKPEQIYLDNGLDAVITMLGLTFINPGDEVVYSQMSFGAYEHITEKMDGKCVEVPITRDYRIDVDKMIASLTAKTKIVFLCNPNNPTGTINTRAEFARLLSALPDTALLVSDEAYFDYADDPEYPVTLPYLAQHTNLIVLRTFSKVMGLAGLRVGYAVAHEDVVKSMMRSREPFPVNRIAQTGALAALDDEEFRAHTVKVNKEGRDFFFHAFDAMGLKYSQSQTNFVFVDVERPGQLVFESMLRDGVIIRPVNLPGAENCLRISLGTAQENARALESLKKALGK